MLKMILAVALGGSLGALGRYGVTHLMNVWKGGDFPYGTMTANMLGCLLIGFLATRLHDHPSEFLRLAVLTGFLGSFTTYSTFGYESVQLLRGDQGFLGFVYLGVHIILGLGLVALGARLAK